MSTVDEIHSLAMEIAEEAFLHQRKGDTEISKAIFIKALNLEKQAAYMLEPKEENEPTRSVLFRSAASLAFSGGDYITAEKLVAQGLIGFPPQEIGNELRDIFDEVTFARHLSLRGMELSESEWKMSLTGSAVAKGIAQADQLLIRVEKFSTLVRRTVERKLHLPFQVNRSISEERKDKYGLFVKAFQPSSFAVVFQLGKPEKQLSLLTEELEAQEIIDELLLCFEKIQNDQIDNLSEHISNPAYFDNFIGLAKQIAPDGNEIKSVGFSVIRGGKEKPYLIKKTRNEIAANVKKANRKNEEESETSIIEGVLSYANTPIGREYGKVKLRREGVKGYEEIYVPVGLMKDVVQPYYDEIVKVSVIFKRGRYFLEDVIK